MEKKKHTKWHSSARSCFFVVKRSNISAHSAFISAEPATTQKERERERIHSFDIPCFVTIRLWRSSPFVKKEGCARCIMGTEESDDRKHSVRWPELTLHILLCNPANSCHWGTKHVTSLLASYSKWNVTRPFMLLSQFPEPWGFIWSFEILLGTEKEINILLMQLQGVLFSPDAEKCHFTVDVGQEAQSGRLVVQRQPRPGSAD